MSSAVMPRMAAWSVELSVDHIGARKEKGTGLDGGTRESVSVSAVPNAVPDDGVAGVLLLVDEAMLGNARQGEDGRARRMWW